MSTTTLLIILLVVALVALASLPFVHKWWTSRPGYQPRAKPPTKPITPKPITPTTQPPSADISPDTAPDTASDAALDESADVLVDDSAQVQPEASRSEPDAELAEADAGLALTDTDLTKPTGKFRSGLAKARSGMGRSLGAISRRSVDEDTWNQLTDALILSDVGVNTATELVDQLRVTAADQRITQGTDLIHALGQQMRSTLQSHDRSLRLTPGSSSTSADSSNLADGSPRTPVWLFVGVNGVGKTTSIGKVGHRLHQDGQRAVFAAADTFRAAATEQLNTWADRCDGYLVSGSVGADPGSVIHDSVTTAAARNYDIVLADTAGRLQNKSNLMTELAKIRRVADKSPGCVTEVLLVIDATTGQNGLSQAESFTQAAEVTGVILTKLDGSAKGGIVFAIESQFGLPVKLVGLGETAEDLVEFDPDKFVDELLGDVALPEAG